MTTQTRTSRYDKPAVPGGPPGASRRLGRSRRYTADNLPERFQTWHAPRANRWELLHMVDGMMQTQWFRAEGIAELAVQAGDAYWIAPGQRWRVAAIGPQAGFELEVHADETVAPADPQRVRSAWLDELTTSTLAQPSELSGLLDSLQAGDQRLLHADFDFSLPLRQRLSGAGRQLFWHPLEATPGSCSIVVGRSDAPLSLAEYLGRDHAVIEAALAGALRGEAERYRWLANVLGRHLVIEEAIVFPAYLEAGGRSGWVDGLHNEHRQLREHLPRLDEPASRRRFLLLLDGHDEKEEQIVYPDIMTRTAEQATDLAQRALMQPPVNAGT